MRRYCSRYWTERVCTWIEQVSQVKWGKWIGERVKQDRLPGALGESGQFLSCCSNTMGEAVYLKKSLLAYV